MPWWVIRGIFLGAKKNWLSPWGEEKIDNAVLRELPCRQNEIDSCREAKNNWLLPWGEEKIDIAMRHELPLGGMKSVLAGRQRKIDYCREAKKNWYRHEAWITVRQNEIDSCHEAKNKKSIIAVRHGRKAEENIAMDGARL